MSSRYQIRRNPISVKKLVAQYETKLVKEGEMVSESGTKINQKTTVSTSNKIKRTQAGVRKQQLPSNNKKTVETQVVPARFKNAAVENKQDPKNDTKRTVSKIARKPDITQNDKINLKPNITRAIKNTNGGIGTNSSNRTILKKSTSTRITKINDEVDSSKANGVVSRSNSNRTSLKMSSSIRLTQKKPEVVSSKQEILKSKREQTNQRLSEGSYVKHIKDHFESMGQVKIIEKSSVTPRKLKRVGSKTNLTNNSMNRRTNTEKPKTTPNIAVNKHIKLIKDHDTRKNDQEKLNQKRKECRASIEIKNHCLPAKNEEEIKLCDNEQKLDDFEKDLVNNCEKQYRLRKFCSFSDILHHDPFPIRLRPISISCSSLNDCQVLNFHVSFFNRKPNDMEQKEGCDDNNKSSKDADVYEEEPVCEVLNLHISSFNKNLNDMEQEQACDENKSSMKNAEAGIEEGPKLNGDDINDIYENIEILLRSPTDSAVYENVEILYRDSAEIICDNSYYTHVYENVELVRDEGSNNNKVKGIFRRETIYDQNNHPIIDRYSKIGKNDDKTLKEPLVKDTLEVPKVSVRKSKLDFVIDELIETEEIYIQNLEVIINDYMDYFAKQRIPSLIGKYTYIFGNVEKIHEKSCIFYELLQSCGNDYEKVIDAFIQMNDELFSLYTPYSRNKTKSDALVSNDFKEVIEARQKTLGDKLDLTSYLMTPIQRLGKYILFLEKIQKELMKSSQNTDRIELAIEIVKKQMSLSNHYVAIDSITDLPFDINIVSGSFLLRGNFTILKPKKYAATLFLFEKILIITVIDAKYPDAYLYKDSIDVTSMGIVIFSEDPLVFHIKRFGKYKRVFTLELECISAEIKTEWVKEIQKLLWKQLEEFKRKTSNI